jgi:hypothetical protein
MDSTPAGGHALVVYESMFGNTALIAEAIGEGLRDHFATVDVVNVTSAPDAVDDVDLLVVGAPTHAFGMPRPKTRDAARQSGASEVADRGVREWLQTLPRPAHPIAAAAFDTHTQAHVPGSARHPIDRRLRRRGFRTTAPISFTVTDTPGPLADGELDAARGWAATVVPAMAKAWVR